MNDLVQWSLIAKYLSGECTLQEKNQVESWLASTEGNPELIEVLTNAWNIREPELTDTDTDTLWAQLAAKAGLESELIPKNIDPQDRLIGAAQQERKTFRIAAMPIWRYAAIFLLFLSTAIYMTADDLSALLGIKSHGELQTVSVAHANREKLTLGDGTRVILDAGSQFSYPVKFNSQTREVFLSGEAFFEVTADPQRPFTVFTDQAVIKVVGTQFNIRAWKPEHKTTVTVSEGEVLFYTKQDSDKNAVTLNPGFASALSGRGKPLPPRPVDVKRSIGWMDNQVYFEDTPLTEVLNQLERWYDVTFDARDTKAVNDRLTVYLQDKPLEDHLILLGELADVRFVGNGKQYYVIPR